MKKILFLILAVFLFKTTPACADKLAERAYHAPSGVSQSKYELINYLTNDLTNDYDKLKVIAYWIASHIAYDGYKYSSSSGVNWKETNYNYDVFSYRTGVCSDYAKLFEELADLANVGQVSYVTGYVLENVSNIKRFYKQKEVAGSTMHAWNKVRLKDGRQFFVDTTFMSGANIRSNQMRRATSLRHKLDVKQRGKSNDVNKNVDDFYFDFTPKKEVRVKHSLHLQTKFIK